MLISGTGKLGDADGTRQAMVDFGVPAPRVALYARLLPIVEISLAGLVLLDFTERLATLGMAALFARFAVGLSHLVGQKKAPPVTALASCIPPRFPSRL